MNISNGIFGTVIKDDTLITIYFIRHSYSCTWPKMHSKVTTGAKPEVTVRKLEKLLFMPKKFFIKRIIVSISYVHLYLDSTILDYHKNSTKSIKCTICISQILANMALVCLMCDILVQ